MPSEKGVDQNGAQTERIDKSSKHEQDEKARQGDQLGGCQIAGLGEF
ncbi:hypothetical protein [Massilia orientalis]|uniref:Uncharacterized protein n=1 Tax=Massilia orientalis TaxID=3050128 RepID=A0ACC7MEV2_9BURK|nr:hypothetical protein [Massilia sp. YIM B02787]